MKKEWMLLIQEMHWMEERLVDTDEEKMRLLHDSTKTEKKNWKSINCVWTHISVNGAPTHLMELDVSEWLDV